MIELSKNNTKGNMNVSAHVLAYIKTGIATRRWEVGEKLPTEKALCEILGVSRASVRSAIHQLTSLGMVRSVQGSGTYVCSNEMAMPLNAITPSLLLNQKDLLSILEFRRIIEIATTGLAAQRATTDEVTSMLTAAERMQNAELQADIVQHDLEFHTLVAQATRNFAIIKVFEIMRESYLGILENNVASLGAIGAQQHAAITAAIATRSPEQAKNLMAEHLDYSAGLYFNEQSTT